MTVSQWGVLFVTTRKTFFYEPSIPMEVRFSLPEVAVSLIIMQIWQALPKNKIFSITLKLIVIDTFIWRPFPHFHGQGNEIVKCEK